MIRIKVILVGSDNWIETDLDITAQSPHTTEQLEYLRGTITQALDEVNNDPDSPIKIEMLEQFDK